LHTLINCVDFIRTERGFINEEIGIFFDLSKAFDTVNHSILLAKMHHYGIRGIAYKWFDSYLRDRLQYTVVNNTASNLRPVSVGVPQGSILGPLLLIIYTNDMQNACDNADLFLFADDSNAFISGSSINEVYSKANETCHNLSAWFKCNLLSVNYDKTSFIVFYPSKSVESAIVSNNLTVSIDNFEIKRVQYTKFLGIFLDENLNFKQHVKVLISKLNSVRGPIYHRRK